MKPIASPPVLSVADERIRRKQRLAAAFRMFAHFEMNEGAAGHITARDPGREDAFWVNPSGVHFGLIRASDLVLVDGDGTVIEGNASINLAAFTIHSRIHRARPDVVAAAHAHSIYGKTWSTLGRLLDPINQDACAFHGDHALFDDFTGVVVKLEEGQRIATALGSRKAIILRNHGLITVGASVDEAAWWLLAMERCCQAQLMAEAVGKPLVMDEFTAKLTAMQVGSSHAGWFNFQPMWDWIIRLYPDLVE